MFCRNCGSEMNENAAVCVKCGISKGEGVPIAHIAEKKQMPTRLSA